MHIELTDHLRCTNDHDEAYLVLLPERADGRRVVSGALGCPVCSRVIPLHDGVALFGPGSPSTNSSTIPPADAAALLGIDGPGGFIALIGAADSLLDGLRQVLAGVRFVLVNPAPGTPDSEVASVVRAARLPIKRSSMRAVVIAGPVARDSEWVRDALAAVLPGNRLVVEGPRLADPGVELLAEAGGVWVGRRLAPPQV